MRVWEKGNPPPLLVECKLVQPLWKTVQGFLKKLKIELPCDPGVTLLGIYPDKAVAPSCVPSSTIYSSQDMEEMYIFIDS